MRRHQKLKCNLENQSKAKRLKGKRGEGMGKKKNFSAKQKREQNNRKSVVI